MITITNSHKSKSKFRKSIKRSESPPPFPSLPSHPIPSLASPPSLPPSPLLSSLVRYIEDIQKLKREVDEKYSTMFHEKIEGMKEEVMKSRAALLEKDAQVDDLKDQMRSYAQQLQAKWKEVLPSLSLSLFSL
jgi:hypothetical protein